MIPKFKDLYILTEIRDTKGNINAMIDAYGLTDYAPEHVAIERAKELMAKWRKYSPVIDRDWDYFGDAKSITGKNYDSRDIFSWARVARDTGENKLEGLQSLESMIEDLKRKKQRNAELAQEEKNYTIVFENEKAFVAQPHSEGASCRLGRGTRWCTASTQGTNMFKSYTENQGVKLFYVITKVPDDRARVHGWQDKWAIAEYPSGIREYFDAEDQPMEQHEFFSEVLKPLDIDPYVFLTKYDPVEAVFKLSAQIEKMREEEEHIIDIRGAEEDMLRMIVELKSEDMAKFQQKRSQTGDPDRVLLGDEDEILTKSMFEFFTNTRLNIVDKDMGYLINKKNRTFQYLIVEMLDNWLELSRKIDSKLDGIQKERKSELTSAINRLGDGEYGTGHNSQKIKVYSKNWTNSNWIDLHEIVMDILIERPHEIGGDCGPAIKSLLGLCIEEKGGRWKELEDHIIEDIKHTTSRLVDKNDSKFSDDKFDDYLIHLGRMGWPRLGQTYNRLVFDRDEFDQKVNIDDPILPFEAEHFRLFYKLR